MLSTWDLVRPRFWYPMTSLEQSMMELEQMSDMMRPCFPFEMHHEVLTAPKFVEDEKVSDNDYFVDLPLLVRKDKPTAFQFEIAPEVASEEESMSASGTRKAGNAKLDTDTSTNIAVDDEGSKKTSRTGITEPKPRGIRPNKKHNKQLRKHSYKVTPITERKVAPKTDGEGRTFSSYTFSKSSMMDEQGRRVTTTRRRYEDSTGRLKAMHERKIDDKKMRTTWSRRNKQDKGKLESICSSGSPEEFEALWQRTPFGEAQKKKVKGQLESESVSAQEGTPSGRKRQDRNCRQRK